MKKVKHLAIQFRIGITAILLAMLFQSCVLQPLAWQPPVKPELSGNLGLNQDLQGLERIDLGGWVGPEDITFDAKGNLYVTTRLACKGEWVQSTMLVELAPREQDKKGGSGKRRGRKRKRPEAEVAIPEEEEDEKEAGAVEQEDGFDTAAPGKHTPESNAAHRQGGGVLLRAAEAHAA